MVFDIQSSQSDSGSIHIKRRLRQRERESVRESKGIHFLSSVSYLSSPEDLTTQTLIVLGKTDRQTD